MEVYLNRNGKGKKETDIATIGDMVVKGIHVYTLEDDYDNEKEYAHTRIPAGRYEIKLRTWGGHHERYQRRFMDIHIGMLQLQQVPNYTDILIHCGNTPEHTAGCIIVGTNKVNDNRISGSEIAYKRIYPIISNALLRGEKVFINIID